MSRNVRRGAPVAGTHTGEFRSNGINQRLYPGEMCNAPEKWVHTERTVDRRGDDHVARRHHVAFTQQREEDRATYAVHGQHPPASVFLPGLHQHELWQGDGNGRQRM